MSEGERFATQVITKEWVQPRDATHKLYKASSDIKDKEGNLLWSPRTVKRTDGQWSPLLVNKDQKHHSVRLSFGDYAAKQERTFTGSVDQVVFGPPNIKGIPMLLLVRLDRVTLQRSKPVGTLGAEVMPAPTGRHRNRRFSLLVGTRYITFQRPRSIVLRGRLGGE